VATNDDLANLRDIARKNAQQTDAELAQELATLRACTRPQLEALKPRLACDEATFNSLLQAVEQATAANISIAEFANRVKTLGTNVLSVARKASALLVA
jgi:hypothetical protein